MKIEFTHHCQQRQDEREISKAQIEHTIRYGTCVKIPTKGTHGGLIRKFYKEIDDKELCVVTEIKSKVCYVITEYFNNRES